MGSNIIPMAESLPNSTFVGVDLSERQIAEGNRRLEKIDCRNLEFMQKNILDIDESMGKFDYIIAHGVFSWVEREAQDKILEIGRQNLTPNGIIYVSYNVLPGWRLRGAIRDMMLYHVEHIPSPHDQIRQAKELIKFLAKSSKTHSQAYPKMLEQEVEALKDVSDSYIYHEYLEKINDPIYFHEFADRAVASGLNYVAESEIHTMFTSFFGEEVAVLLKNLPMLRREQYMDFLRSRTFRTSLLSQAETVPNYNMPPSCILPLHVGLEMALVPETTADGYTTWSHSSGTINTKSPMTEVFTALNHAWPGWVSVQELADGPLKESSSNLASSLRNIVFALKQGIVKIAKSPPGLVRRISDHPACTPFARLQAAESEFVTNRTHSNAGLERLTRIVLESADGTRTVEDIAAVLQELSSSGKIKVTKRDGQVESTTDINWRALVLQELDRLSAFGYLVG